MNNTYNKYIILIAFFTFVIGGSNFHILDEENNIFELDMVDISKKIESFNKQLNSSELEFNETILPSYTSFYQIKDGFDISVTSSLEDFSPHSFVHESMKSKIVQNTGLDSQYFPKNNLVVSEEMIFRGLVVKQITYYPFRINLSNGELEYLNNVNILIDEYQSDVIRDNRKLKKSKLFEDFYENLIINYETSNRSEDYQSPSILYICGGSSIDNSYVQNLLEWRHKSGYVVNSISTNEIGSSSSDIKNYIQNAYDNWENPQK